MDRLLLGKPLSLNPLEEPGIVIYKPRSWWLRYGAGVAAVLLILVIVQRFWPYEYGRIFLFLVAVVVSAWFGGMGPGVLATLLSIPLISLYALHPFGEFSVSLTDIPLLGLFLVVGVFISMLEESRRRTGEMLQRSRDQFRVILQGIADGITAQDKTGRLIYANDTAARVTGFSSARELLETPIADVLRRFEVYSEDGKPFPLSELPGRRALQEGIRAQATLQFRTLATGEERFSVVKASPVHDKQGNVQLAINLFQDITALKQSQSALTVERERLRVTLASIGDGVIATDIEGRVEFMNPVAEALTGWPQAEAVAKPVGEVFHIINEESRARVENPVSRALAEGVVIGLANHTLLISRDGMEHPIDDSGAPIRNLQGETIGAVLIFRDITARRQIEQTLQEAYARTVEILESLGDAFYALDHEWRFTYVNRKAEQYWGKRRDELLGKVIWEVFPQVVGSQSYEEQVRAVRENRTVSFETVSPVLQRWIEVRIYPTEAGLSVYFHDISQRRQVETERAQLMVMIEQQRQRLNNILGNVPGVVWEAWGKPDVPSQRLDFVSEYVEQLLGYSAREWLDTPNFWLTVVHPEDRERAAAESAAIFSGERPGISRFRWVAKDGRVIPVEAHSTVIHDESGHPIGMRGVTMDISERVRAEDAMRKNEALYRTLMEAMPQFVWSMGNDGLLTYGNKLFSDYTGVSVEEVNQMGWGLVVHPDDLPRMFANWQHGIDSGDAHETELRFRRPDGVYRWFVNRVVPVRDSEGKIINWVGTSTDIHERKLAEEDRLRLVLQLEQQSRRLNDLVANVPGVVWESWGATDPGEGKINFVSEYIVNLLGYPLENWLTIPDFHYSILHPDDKDRYVAETRAIYSSRKQGVIQFRWIAEDSQAVWVASYQIPILDNDGKAVGVRGVTIDVTARKQAEEALRESEQRWRLVLENMPILLSVNDDEGNRLVWNKEAERVTGYTSEEMVNSTMRRELLYPDPDYRAAVVAELDSYQRNFRDHELKTTCKDGSTRIIAWSNLSNRYPIPGWPDWALGVDITERKRAEERLERLQAITAALSQALTPLEVADVILSVGGAAVGMLAGAVAIVVEQGNILEVIRSTGYSSEITQQWHRFSINAPTPLSDAVRTMTPLFIGSRQVWERLYPDTPILESVNDQAWAVIPFTLHEHAPGGLIFSFSTSKDFPEEERAFILALAQHGAQTFERARLYEAEQQARAEAETAQKRLGFLAEASALLASSLDYEETLEHVAQLAVRTIADWCVIDVLGDDGSLHRVAITHANPAKQGIAYQLQYRYPVLKPDERHTTLKVIRANQSWFDPEVSEVRLALEARDDEHLQLLRELGFNSEIVVSLNAHGKLIGTITLVLGESGRRYTQSDLELAEELARRAASAVDNAWLYRQAQEARADAVWAAARTTRLQAVTAALSQALTTEQISEVVISQGLETLGAFAGSLYLLSGEELRLVRAVGYEQQMLEKWRRYPLTTRIPIADAVRTCEPIWLESDEQRRVRYPEIAQASKNQNGSWVAVPLIVEGRAFGGMGLSFATPRQFREEDKAFVLALAQQCAQALERARLYETVEREQQRQTFLAEATAMLASSLDYEITLQSIAFLAVPLIADWCSVYVVSDDGKAIEQLVVAHTDPTKVAWAEELQRRYPPDPDSPRGVWNVLRTGQPEFYPLITEDLLKNVTRDEEHLRLMKAVGFSSAMMIPLIARGRTIGAMTFISAESGRTYEPEADISLVQELARRAAIAVDNSRLYHQEQQQQVLSEALRDTAMVLSSSLNLPDVLDQILASVGRVVPHDAADIMFLEDGIARIERSKGYVTQGLVESEEAISRLRLEIDKIPNLRWTAEHKQPLAIADTETYDEWISVQQSHRIRSCLSAPIIIEGDVIGFINVNSLTPGFFTTQGDTLQAFANQAAVAIRNARLHQQAQKLAALEERQRLARDLHDAVSQTLFSASVIAESLPRLWEREPGKILPKLHQLSRLNRGALAEMRTLLLELRPAALLNTSLGDLVTQLAEAIKGRREMVISLHVQDDQPLPPDVHIAVYRIIQETLNNIMKHAQASEINIYMRSQPQHVEMRIKDDGRGFDLHSRPAGLGLGTMHERAQAIGAVLEITSVVGSGTEVSLVWSAISPTTG